MPRRCCVPGCSSNYGVKNDVTVFRFPKDLDRRKEWSNAIHRADFIPNNSSVVCELHFRKNEVKRFDETKMADGSIVKAKKYHPELCKFATPSIFPGQPKYLTKSPPKCREGVSRRDASIQKRDDERLTSFLKGDEIVDYKDFSQNLKEKQKCGDGWVITEGSGSTLFLKIDSTNPAIPKIVSSVQIESDLSVTLQHNNVPLSSKKFEWILGEAGICDRWSKLESLLSNINSFSGKDIVVDKRKYAVSLLEEIYEDTVAPTSSKFNFIKEQLDLLEMNPPRYSPELLVFASTMFYSNPSAYRYIRDSDYISLPHPDYLRKLSCNCQINSTGFNDSHKRYLQQHLSGLSEEKKLVNLLIDEIHVKSKLSYKAGKITGAASNNADIANSLQVFMISSLRSSYKDIVALYPVKNMTALNLQEMLIKILKILSELGFKIISIISDNNKLNGKMFQLLSHDNKLHSEIQHVHSQSLFFLFDTVHLLKSIRNNWLNVKRPYQTFIVPEFDDNSAIHNVPFQQIKDLYISERDKLIKLAPNLSQKSIFPSNFERQNVNYVLSIFNEKTVASIKTMYPKSYCSDFLNLILKWWNIVNVQTPHIGQRKRNSDSDPVTAHNRSSLNFLNRFCL